MNPAPTAPLTRARRWLPLAVLAAALLHNLVVGWRAWGDLVVDGGRELELARQLATGQRLYADVRYYYGPLAPYVNAALFLAFGPRLEVLMGAGLVSVGLMCALIHALGVRLAGPAGALAVATAFLYLCAFAHLYPAAIFNWVMPYAYPATYGMLAAVASLLLLLRHLTSRRPMDFHLSVVCLALAALAKMEALLPAATAHAMCVMVARRDDRPRLGPYVLTAAAVTAIYAGLATAAGRALVADNLGAPFNPRALPVILTFMGLADWRLTGVALVASCLAFALVLATAVGAAWLAGQDRAWMGAVAVLVCAAVPLAVYAVLPSHRTLRFLPLLLAALVLRDARRAWQTGERSVLAHLLLWTFALASLARMPLSAGVEHYGFYLLPVPLVALAAFWFGVVPEWLAARGRPRWVAAFTGAVMLAVVLVPHYRRSREFYARHTVHVRAPRGETYLLADVGGYPAGAAHAAAIRHLATFPPATRVLALPQGVGLAFLAGLRSWDGMHSFLPPELPDAEADARLVTELERDPPDVVLWIGMDLGEYGTAGFGIDYAQRTLAWVRTRYRTEAAFGPGGYVLVMKPAPG